MSQLALSSSALNVRQAGLQLSSKHSEEVTLQLDSISIANQTRVLQGRSELEAERNGNHVVANMIMPYDTDHDYFAYKFLMECFSDRNSVFFQENRDASLRAKFYIYVPELAGRLASMDQNYRHSHTSNNGTDLVSLYPLKPQEVTINDEVHIIQKALENVKECTFEHLRKHIFKLFDAIKGTSVDYIGIAIASKEITLTPIVDEQKVKDYSTQHKGTPHPVLRVLDYTFDHPQWLQEFHKSLDWAREKGITRVAVTARVLVSIVDHNPKKLQVIWTYPLFMNMLEDNEEMISLFSEHISKCVLLMGIERYKLDTRAGMYAYRLEVSYSPIDRPANTFHSLLRSTFSKKVNDA